MIARRFAIRSVASKIRILIVATAAAAMLVAIGVLGTLEGMYDHRQMVNGLSALARITAANAVGPLEFEDHAAATTLVRSLSSEPAIMSATLFTPGGATIGRYIGAFNHEQDSADMESLKKLHPRLFAAQFPPGAGPLVDAEFFGSHLAVIAPVELNGEIIGYLLIEETLAGLYKALQIYAWVAFAVILATLVMTYLATIRLQRSLTQPLFDLVATIRQVSDHQDFEVRAAKVSDDEIGALVDGFNHMLSQVKARDERLQEHREFLESEISDRTAHLESALLAAQQASKTKSEFLARMSHEIRTPMNGVLGMTELLQHTALDIRQRRLLAIVRRSAESLLQVINDILDFSRVEAGRLELEHARFNLCDTLEESAEMLAERARSKGLELICAIDPRLPEWVHGDPLRLRQILINLVGNAIKFTEQGEVLVRVMPVPGEPRVMRFEVVDTGVGIAAEAQEHVFEAFTQADAFTTRHHGGTGLGLAIVRQLVDLMGGKVGVSSEVGRGSTFWLQIPMANAGEALLTRRRRESLHGARVLVADDNATNRGTIAQALRAWDVVVDVAADGREAHEIAVAAATRGEPFDLLILDHEMPGLDGISCIRRLRQTPATQTTRVLLLCSVDLVLSSQALAELGFAESLSKPARQARLYAAVGRAVGRDPALETQSQAASPQTIERPAANSSLRVLVVEDNEINREVAAGMLNACGYAVESAANGALALERIAAARYDLVLMDCQMPVMDGFAAAAQMRALEQREGRQRLAIVALTANAIEGDRERCLDAGMDDFLSKPFTLAQLRAVVQRWGHSGTQADSPWAGTNSSLATAPVVDMQIIATIQSLPRPDLLERLIFLFEEHTPPLLQEGNAALADASAERLAAVAHTLKSSSGNLGGNRLAQMCNACETAARARDIATAGLLWRNVVTECALFRAALLAIDNTAVA